MKEKRFAAENLPEEIQVLAEAMNWDADAIGDYMIPELPFSRLTTPDEFTENIRPQLLEPFVSSMYGAIPECCENVSFKLVSEAPAYGNLAIRREIDIICRHKNDEQILHLLLYIPQCRQGKVPVFFGLNFLGNHAATTDPEVTFYDFEPAPDLWSMRYNDRRATASQRGIQAHRFAFEEVLQRGFASATIDYNNIYFDRPEGFATSIMRFFFTPEEWHSSNRPSGAISAWAWGIMRALDCLSEQPEIDSSKFIVHGHSRLGKTALWAAVNDPRIWMAVSNCSGTAGAKLAHRNFGETYAWLNCWYNYWFCGKFGEFAGRDQDFPADQHFLLAAIAPRLLYVSSGNEDIHADPHGEYLAAKLASRAWNIFDRPALENTSFPECGELIGGDVGYYLRRGGHDFTPENWQALLTFVEKHL
ncbi:MAG: hypothetical protein E7052_05540 [Lentisphaerae bacterium]|nr:hypothetical protein [Lentisphaerota bacterium]